MAGKKGIIPSHVKKKHFDHPGIEYPVIQPRYRNRIRARNLAAMRKIVLNALSRETSMKGGIATKQFAAVVNPVYRERVFKNLF